MNSKYKTLSRYRDYSDLKIGSSILIKVPDNTVIIGKKREYLACHPIYFADRMAELLMDDEVNGGKLEQLLYKVSDDRFINLRDWIRARQHVIGRYGVGNESGMLKEVNDSNGDTITIFDYAESNVSGDWDIPATLLKEIRMSLPKMEYLTFNDNPDISALKFAGKDPVNGVDIEIDLVDRYIIPEKDGMLVDSNRIELIEYTNDKKYKIESKHFDASEPLDLYTGKDLHFTVYERNAGNFNEDVPLSQADIMNDSLIFHNGLLQEGEITKNAPAAITLRDVDVILEKGDMIKGYDVDAPNYDTKRNIVGVDDGYSFTDSEITDKYRFTYRDDIRIVKWKGIAIKDVTVEKSAYLDMDLVGIKETLSEYSTKIPKITYPSELVSPDGEAFPENFLLFLNGELVSDKNYKMSEQKNAIQLLNRTTQMYVMLSDILETSNSTPFSELEEMIKKEKWEVKGLSYKDSSFKAVPVMCDTYTPHDPSPFEIRFPSVSMRHDLFFQDGTLEHFDLMPTIRKCIRLRNSVNSLRGDTRISYTERERLVDGIDFLQLYLIKN